MSIFDPNAQKSDIDSKLLVTLEKFSELFRVMLWQATQQYQASPLQIQTLIFLHYHQKQPQLCQNSHLAQEFNVTRATMSDAVKSLVQKGLVIKTIQPSDKRNRTLTLTQEGNRIARQASGFAEALKAPLAQLEEDSKSRTFEFLMQLLHKLNKNGLISIERMCFGCPYYKGDFQSTHYCSLLQESLETSNLRFDCELEETE